MSLYPKIATGSFKIINIKRLLLFYTKVRVSMKIQVMIMNLSLTLMFIILKKLVLIFGYLDRIGIRVKVESFSFYAKKFTTKLRLYLK